MSESPSLRWWQRPRRTLPDENSHRENSRNGNAPGYSARDGSSRAERRRSDRRAVRPSAPALAPTSAEAVTDLGPEMGEAIESRDAELIVAVFRTVVLLVALFVPRILNLSIPYNPREFWLAGFAGVYNIVIALSYLSPRRYALRRPFIVAMDALLITLWIGISYQWDLFAFYYIVVVIAAMWFRVPGGVVAAALCIFFYLFIWGSASGDPSHPPLDFTPSMALNTTLLSLVGCLVGFVAEAQEAERQSRLESQLLIANYQREIDLSMQLQPLLMPSELLEESPVVPGQATNAALRLRGQFDPQLEIGVAMQTARRLGGGDYFDLIPLDGGRTALCIADVSGKSVRAQARLPLLKYSLRALAPLYAEPDVLVGRLNQTLAPDLQPELYIALCYIVLDPRGQTLSWCNAGHIAPLLVAGGAVPGAGGTVPQAPADTPPALALETDGPALGMFSDMSYTTHCLPWRPTDQLLLFTDGLVDALSYGGSEDGETQVRRLSTRLAKEQEREPRRLAQDFIDLASAALDATSSANPLARLRRHTHLAGEADARHRDDMTVVVVRYKPQA